MIVENLQWRYATKKFTEGKEIPAEDMAYLKEAIRLSPSSFGLQLYKVLIIKDPELRKQLREVSWNQPQITESSALVVFCSYRSVSEEDLDLFIELVAKERNIAVEDLAGYRQVMGGFVSQFDEPSVKQWTSKQTYIALESLLLAAAERQIDACPMEGFDANAYDEILGLEEKGLHASVVAAVGYRSEEDHAQGAAKVRRASEDLFVEL